MPITRHVLFGMAVVFFLASGGCYSLIAEVDTLQCDRETGFCTLRQSKVFGTTMESFAVEELKGAELGRVGDDSEPSTARRLVLITTKGPVPFMNYATDLSMAEMEEQVGAVARYLGSETERRLEFARDNRLSSFLLAMIPFSVGVVLLIASKRV